MKIEVLKEKENHLLNRKEINFKVVFEGGTPNIKDVRKELVGSLHASDKLTVVDSMMPAFGKKSLKGYAKVYKDEKSMSVEPKFRIKKNFGVKEEPKDATAAAPAAAQAPAPPAPKKEEKK